MSSIFNLDNGKKIAIYNIGANIYANPLPLFAGSQPMLIATDYKASLHCCVHNKALYFLYKNNMHNLVLGSLPLAQPQMIFNDEALLFEPEINLLTSCPAGTLLFTASVKNPLNDTYSIDIFSLVPNEERISVIGNLSTPPVFLSFLMENFLYVILNSSYEESKKARIFSINMQTFITNPSKSICEIPTLITLTPPCENCKHLESRLKSVTSQYNALAETTLKIQAEGRLWKQLYEEMQD